MSRRRSDGSYHVEEYLHETERVECPHCGAQPDEPCTNPHTGQPLKASHWQRHKASQHPEETPR